MYAFMASNKANKNQQKKKTSIEYIDKIIAIFGFLISYLIYLRAK